MRGFWQKVPWWLRAGCISVLFAGLWLGAMLAGCYPEGPACAYAGKLFTGINAPYSAAAQPVLRAVARSMGLNPYLVLRDPIPQKHEAWIGAAAILGAVLYWFGIGVILYWTVTLLKGVSHRQARRKVDPAIRDA